MNKTIKLIFASVLAFFTLIMFSCNNDDGIPNRTPEMEQNEISKALASLEDAGYNIDTTETGLFYILHKEGSGPTPQKADSCSVIYNGYFLSGVMFDSSALYYQDSIWHFRYKEVPLIPGFNEGVGMLNKGAIADILVPSDMAYGALGYGNIGPYTPLFFTIKMKDLKPVTEE